MDLAKDRDKWGCFCECGDEPTGFKKCGELLEQLKDCWLFNKGRAPSS